MNRELAIIIGEPSKELSGKIIEGLGKVNPAWKMFEFDNDAQLSSFLFGKDMQRQQLNNAVVLLDMNIPDAGGMDMLCKIKENSDTHSIPVIIMAANSEAAIVEECHQNGCSVYVEKTTDIDEFVDAITRIGRFISIVEFPKV